MFGVVMGCDEAAANLRDALKKVLLDSGFSVEDEGVENSGDKTAYPLVAEKVCKKIIESGYKKRGVLVCGTGIGMCISANKFRGIRAAVCHDIFSTRRSVLSNDCNVACFGERVIGAEHAKANLAEWIRLEFTGGPSLPKVEEIKNLEKGNFR